MAAWPYNTRAWRLLRQAKLAIDPLCAPCNAMGIITLANTVDHDHPVNDGGDPFPCLADLTSMCPSCHGAKTARGSEAGAIRSSKARKGCDVDGNPLDPNHPWNVEKSLRAAVTGPTRVPILELVRGGLWDGR